MSVCIIGNSHLAALKMGLAQPEAKAINPRTIQFWGAPGKIVAEARMQDGRLTMSGSHLKLVHMTSNGVDAVDPALYQAVVVHALGLNLPGAILEIARAGRPSWAFLQAAVRSFLHSSRAFEIVTAMRARTPDIPYVLSLQPCASERVLGPDKPSPVPAALRKEMLALFDRAVLAEGLKLLGQPATTLSDRANYTRDQWSVGSVKLTSDNLHPEDDTQHMNAAYGALVLKGLVSMLKLKLAPDVPDAPPRPTAPEAPAARTTPSPARAPDSKASEAPEAAPVETLPAHQISNRTWHDRHPFHIGVVKSAVQASAPRVLSFGCAGGEECNDIAKRWPEAHIFGTDLREGLLAKGRARYGSDRVEFFLSTEANLKSHSPFDAVFAMNVFFRHPEDPEQENISQTYPFEMFEQTVSLIDSVTAVDGVFCLVGSNYFFEDTLIADKYRPIDGLEAIGMMERYDPNGQRATDQFSIWNGRTYDRREWAEVDKAAIDRDEVRHFQLWRPGVEANGRHLTTPIWRKVR